MSDIKKLCELVDDLESSASNEGCSDDLTVVSDSNLDKLVGFTRSLKVGKLRELVDDLESSASNEGCSDDLTVVRSSCLGLLVEVVRLLRAGGDACESSGCDDGEKICDRLLDSEEYDDDYIPFVAEDAVDVIRRLSRTVKASQCVLAVVMQHSETLEAL